MGSHSDSMVVFDKRQSLENCHGNGSSRPSAVVLCLVTDIKRYITIAKEKGKKTTDMYI